MYRLDTAAQEPLGYPTNPSALASKIPRLSSISALELDRSPSSERGRRSRAIRLSDRPPGQAGPARAAGEAEPGAATSVAQAPSRSRASPTPRSQTRSAIASRALISANEIWPFPGTAGGSRSGARSSQRDHRDSPSTQKIACGCHVDEAGCSVSPAPPCSSISVRRRVGDGARQRISLQASRGAHVDAVGPRTEPLADDQPGGRSRSSSPRRPSRAPVGRRRSASVAARAGFAAVVL